MAVVLAVLGPVLPRGFVLRYDLVFVPDPAVNDFVIGADGGLPRAVPSELLAVALGSVLPADIAQKLLLAAVLAIACIGAARLAPVQHPLARVAAGVFYVWNPWIYGRLHLGQWAIIAAYAGLPWIFAAVIRATARPDGTAPQDGPARSDATARPDGTAPPEGPVLEGGSARPERALRPSTAVLGALPLALGGPALAVAGALLCAPALALARRWRALAWSTLALVGLCAAWLVPVLVRGGGLSADADGIGAFSSRADTPLGVAASVLSLGGIWTRNAVPPGRDTWAVGVAALLLTAVAFAGYVRARRTWPVAAWRGLAVAAAVGAVVAILTSVEAVSDAVSAVPGATVVRDATRLLGPLALLQAVGLGFLVEWLSGLRYQRALAVLAALAPVAIMPALVWGLGGELRTVRYPDEWTQVRRAVGAGDEAVLALPFATFRGFAWNDRTTLLDPATRVLDRPVVAGDDVWVGDTRISGENARSRRVAAVLAQPGPLDLAALRAEGVRYVLVERDQPGAEVEGRIAGAQQLHDGRDLGLWRLPGTVANRADPAVTATCWIGHITTVSTVLTLLVIPLTRTRIRMLLSGNSRQEDST